MITIEINTQALQNSLSELEGRLKNRRPLMANLARILHNAVDDNFAANGRPGWKPLKYPRPRGGSGILQSSGHLRNSMTTQADNNRAVVGTNVVYAAIHNFGGQTSPHVIRPKNGKALAFGGKWSGRGKKRRYSGTVVAQVNHPGSKIPARPFMTLQPADEAALADAVRDYLAQGIGS